jgi:hypothetical protein
MKYPEIFDTTWNEFVVESYPIITSLIEPKAREVMERHNLGKKFIDCVQWDVGHIIMEDVYRDTNAPARFFSELLKFYETGHFPCGWKGPTWPVGWPRGWKGPMWPVGWKGEKWPDGTMAVA